LGIINVLRLEAQEVLDKENTSLDPLTKILDKNAFMERLRQKIENSRRNGLPFALIFISLAPVRQAHAQLSQSDMDSIMWGVVNSFQQDIRQEVDITARFGYDEFAIVLPGASEKMAQETAEKIRANIKQNVTIVENVQVETTVAVSEYPKQILAMGGANININIMEEVEDLIMFTCSKLVSDVG